MFAEVNGIRLYYEETGRGRPLLLIHGNGESHAIFSRAVPELARTHRVITPDSRCHGESQQTETLTYEDMAEDLIALIRQLGLEKPIFYGFSDGGILGLLIALKTPELLGSLIISGANLNPAGLRWRALLDIRIRAALGDRLNQLMAHSPDIHPEDLGKITIPVTVLAGERDVIRRKHTEQIAAAIPGAVLRILPGETHGSYIVDSDRLPGILMPYL